MKSERYTVQDVALFPKEPGIYKFYNESGDIIYVGKAKNLKSRVSSYFQKSKNLSGKTRKLVSEIKSIDFTLSSSEFDALLLENNLIKANQPKYNILLKDDKTYPYICILKERFPRIISTRNFIPGKGEYFGPFSSVVAMKNVLQLLTKLYTIRTCNFNLSAENVQNGKFKVCLEYHIKNCLGPCEGLQEEADYNKDIRLARDVIKGNLNEVKTFFESEMNEFAMALNFEKAQQSKEKLDLLEKYKVKSIVVNPKILDTDVFTITSDEATAYINYLKIKKGSIVFSRTVELKRKLEETDETILIHAIYQLRDLAKSQSPDVFTNIEMPGISEQFKLSTPQIGDKRKLVELSLKNAIQYKRDKFLKATETPKRVPESIIQLQEYLKLRTLPDRIECFDNSNIQGTNPVSSMVCFINGKPAKKEYRHYKVKTVEGPNDFASMKEVVYRRYKRVKEEQTPFPQLIVIDGGKGQLSSAVAALKQLKLYTEIPIIGIAKRLEEIYYPEDPIPLHISKKSPALKLIQHLRDEAHRFAINFHRDQRSKNAFNFELEGIRGIGQKTVDELMLKYKTLKRIQEAGPEAVADLIGLHKTKIVFDYIHKKKA